MIVVGTLRRPLLYSICQGSSGRRVPCENAAERCLSSGPCAIGQQCYGASNAERPRRPGAVHCAKLNSVFALGSETNARNITVTDLDLGIGHQPAVDGGQEAAEQGRREPDSCGLGHLQSRILRLWSLRCERRAISANYLGIPDARYNGFICIAAILLLHRSTQRE
jgi:hypothetical protein